MQNDLFILGLASLLIEASGDVVENLVDDAGTVHSEIFTVLGVIVAEREGLIMIYFKTVFDGVEIVISPTCLLAASQHSFDEFFFRHFESDNGVKLGSTLFEQFFECLGLGNRAGKTIENDTILC